MNEQYGVMSGIVKDVNDPTQRGRVQVEFPWMGGRNQAYWAPIAAPMAGNERGAYFMPEVGDEVLVACEHGDINHIFVIGFTWNGVDAPPTRDVRERMIRSVNGHAIRMLDSTPNSGDNGALIIQDANGNVITMANGVVTIHAEGVLVLEGASIVLRPTGGVRVVQPSNNPV